MLSLDFCLEGKRVRKTGRGSEVKNKAITITILLLLSLAYIFIIFFLLNYSSLFVLHGIRHPPSLFEDTKSQSRSFKSSKSMAKTRDSVNREIL